MIKEEKLQNSENRLKKSTPKGPDQDQVTKTNYINVLLQAMKNLIGKIRNHYITVTVYQKKVEQKRKGKGSSTVTIIGKECEEKQELNRFIRLAIEHEMALQISMVLPLVLTALYILFVENGKLFWPSN